MMYIAVILLALDFLQKAVSVSIAKKTVILTVSPQIFFVKVY